MAFSGTIGTVEQGEQRKAPDFIVDDIVDLESAVEKETRELHIELSPYFSAEEALHPLRDSLYAATGSAEVFFHFPADKERRVVRADSGIRVNATRDFMQKLTNSCSAITQIWTN
jgi:DNA polymerase III alpha subunit